MGLAAAAVAASLLTWGYGNERQGATRATSISPGRAANLAPAWRRDVGGAIDTQPLVARGLVVVGEGHGAVVALRKATGRVAWRRQLGTRRISPSCQASPDGRFGVTSTPVIDARARVVYAVDALGRLYALRLASGRVLPGWPVRVHPADATFVWSALTLSRGRVYVPLGSLCDQGGRYDGGIAAVDTATRAVTRWRTTEGTGSYAGAIWGWGGVSADASGDLFGATGNSLGSDREDEGYSERVVRLDPRLKVLASDLPLAPPFTVGDRDFGTTPVLFRARGCPPQLVALNKTGEAFLYDRDRIAAGPVQRLRVAGTDGIPLYGVPAYDPRTRTLVLFSTISVPGTKLRRGLRAYALTKGCRLKLRWQARPPSDAAAPPVIGGAVVYVVTGRSGLLTAWRLSDGRQLLGRSLDARFGAQAAPSVVGDRVYAADWSGRVWSFRAR